MSKKFMDQRLSGILTGECRANRLAPYILGNRGILWIIVVGVAAGFVFPLTKSLAGMQDADGILAALISTQKLTWYYWGQDRFLSFIPALAKPFIDVEQNLRVQIFLRAFFAYLAPVGILYFLSQSSRFLVFAIVLANCLLGITLSQSANFNLYVEENPFGTSLVLFALSLAVLRRGDTNVGWISLSLIVGFFAYTTNMALLVITFPLILLTLCVGTMPRAQLFRFLVINIACVVLAYAHSRYFGEGETAFQQLDISWRAVGAGYASVAADISWIGLIVLGIFVIAFGHCIKVPNLSFIILLMIGSVALIGVLSCSHWPQINKFNIRYYLTFIIVIIACISYIIVHACQPFLYNQKYSKYLIGAVFIAEVVFGLHGFSANYLKIIESGNRNRSGAIAAAAITHHAQLVIGDYWDVWPTIFDIMRARPAGVGDAGEVYGAAYRGHVLRDGILRVAGRGRGISALCLVQTVDACVETAENSLRAPMNVVPGSVENLTVADEQMLLMRLEFASQDMPFGLPVLTSITARSVITASGSPVFLPSKSLLRIPVEFANKGTLEFTSSGDRPVNLGIQLLSRNGSVERLDFARVSIPHIAAGSKAIVAVEVPIAELNNRNLLILPVQEGVAWFDKFDVKGLEVGPFYACLDKERPWVCNASHIAMPEGK